MALCANAAAVVATGSWTIYRSGWQFTGSEGLDEACVSFFGAFRRCLGRSYDRALER